MGKQKHNVQKPTDRKARSLPWKGSPGVSNKIGPLAYDELSQVLQKVQGCPAKSAISAISAIPPKIVKNWTNRTLKKNN